MGLDWNDPTVVVRQYFDYIKLQHALGGLLIWEVVTSAAFDWELITKMSQHRGRVWVKVVFLVCRYAALGSVVSTITGVNVTSEINCKVWLIFVLLWAFLAIQCASTLVAIRVVAIWNKSTYMIGLSAAVLTTQFAFFCRALTQAEATWLPALDGCMVINSQSSQANVTVTMITDLFLLVAMLVGLLRRRQARAYSLWRVLWNQGLLWLVLATIAEVPTVVFLYLNLNQVMNLMFFTPEMLILAIGATRMYRSLSDFTNASSSAGVSASAQSAPDVTPMHRMRGARQADSAFGAVTVPLEVEIHRTSEERHEADKGYIADADSGNSGKYLDAKHNMV